MTTMKTAYQTAGLISLSQKLIRVAAAESSAGAVTAMMYQKFHLVAVPTADCTNLVTWRTKPPVTGIKADISPVDRATPQAIRPMQMYPKRAPTGPAVMCRSLLSVLRQPRDNVNDEKRFIPAVRPAGRGGLSTRGTHHVRSEGRRLLHRAGRDVASPRQSGHKLL